VAAQDALSRELCEAFGATWDQFRLDTTVHPFEITFGLGDVRLTSRYSEHDLLSLFTAMHECGHGLYEWGVSPSLERTPLCQGVSATLHESQSRLWENIVGRSLPFWRWFYPRLQETFPDPLGAVSLEDFHRAVNRVRRSFIRVDADETSYGLHIILRFELEQELLTGRLNVKDLPDAWNSRFEQLVGLSVPDDAHGVLQDAHWSTGGFGYFPTYLLGTVLSVQIWERASAAIPALWEQIERGEFAELHGWLRETIYALGSKLTPAETVERAVGGPIDPQPYLAYLRGKL
jgi:carboxypeptidase Taq